MNPRITALAGPLALLLGLALPAPGRPAHAASGGPSAHPARLAEYRGWVEAMKGEARGPFEAIRWFCADGTVHPAKPYPCGERGGGIQHGDWNDRTRTLRDDGYLVANVIAEVEPAAYTGEEARLDDLAQILVERYLIAIDDGWILRAARSYRGALQAEDEERGARELLLAMLADPAWREPERYLLLRETARLLPLQTDEASATSVRALALEIADKDRGFERLRIKIHGSPDASDAAAVREYAAKRGKRALAADYARLATAIDALYAPRGAADALAALAQEAADPELARSLREAAAEASSAEDPARRLGVSAARMSSLRDLLAELGPEDGLLLLRASLALERDAYAAGNTLVTRLGDATRRERIAWLRESASALYGTGLIGRRQLRGLATSMERITSGDAPTLGRYREELRYLGRVSEWAGQALSFHFGPAMARLAGLDDRANVFVQDRLRGSPLLLAGAVVDSLTRDANRLAGVESRLFGRDAGGGLRALNPGLARGPLYAPGPDLDGAAIDSEGIYLLPETVADLPRVAGILTRGEGSSLSHVQLLARNLGIPNVVVGDEVLPAVRTRVGQRVVLAVSRGGVVRLSADGRAWDDVFGREQESAGPVVIRPDLEKLDLEATELVGLEELRASDSGRISGPKGANLGELKHHFGDRVPDGFVIPFGAFRKLLDQPLEPGGPPVYEWMKARYAAIDGMRGPERERAVREFLARLRAWIENANPGVAFAESLRGELRRRFGADGTYGVFVRSDTNVEDLPGFTGAGLNLTVPNVVGVANIEDAVRRVWSSPFTERAYSWRQAHMEQPEYVFPAVVVQYSFPAEKSGVMVTTDLEAGEPDWISVAVSEGVGGAVEGQATESLRINTRTGVVRYLARAASPARMVLSATGGVDRERASGSERVLENRELVQLVRLSQDLGRWPSLRGPDGETLPADVEFAFRDGELALLQVRPFVESKSAMRNPYLQALDAPLAQRDGMAVDLDAVPEDPS